MVHGVVLLRRRIFGDVTSGSVVVLGRKDGRDRDRPHRTAFAACGTHGNKWQTQLLQISKKKQKHRSGRFKP
jgi:hypothetical protein